MRILKLQAENVKRLKAIEIIPDGPIIKITGKNRQGKTSTLDAIWLALGGEDGAKGTATTRPVREGEKRALARLDLGEYVVTRTWDQDGKSTLKVESADGVRFAGPQTLLNSLVGNLTFDPLAFMNMDAKKQRETLLKMVGIDPAAMDRKRQQIFEDRTLVNRQVKELDANLNSFSLPTDEGLPAQEIEATDLMAEYQDALETIAANNRKREQLQTMRGQANTIIADIEELEKQIQALLDRVQSKKVQLSELQEKGKTFAVEVAAVTDPDLESIRTRMEFLDQTNELIREKRRYLEIEKKRNQMREKSDLLTAELADIDKAKEKAIRSAKLPIAGLGFTEDGVTYNGIPLAQASHAEQWQVSMAMGMSINPKLRIMLIKDGEKFDTESMALVEQMARDHDYQVWIEMVEESGKVGIYIEDGEVKSNATA